MDIQYALRESDILALVQYRLRQKRGRHNPVLVRRVAYLIGFTLLGLGTGVFLQDAATSIIFLAFAVIAFILYPTFFNWLIRRKVMASYRDPPKKATLSSRTLLAAPDGLEEKSDMGEIKVKWENVDDLAVTPSHAFISILGKPSIVVPIDLINDDDFQVFVNTCREHITRAAT